MSRVTMSTNDPMVYIVKDEKETIEYFGEDFLKEYGVDIPDELLEAYNKAYQDFWKVQLELEAYYSRY